MDAENKIKITETSKVKVKLNSQSIKAQCRLIKNWIEGLFFSDILHRNYTELKRIDAFHYYRSLKVLPKLMKSIIILILKYSLNF